MAFKTELNPGEIKVYFDEPTSGNITFAEMGIKDEDLKFDGGLVRIVFDFENIGEHNYFKVPTINISYTEEMGETHWQCDYNRTTILDKHDHHGHSTVVLLNRKKLAELEHHHKNALVLHAEFPKEVQIIANDSKIHFFN
ncbi:MAG: hypothetical protein ACI9JN_001553 [Bacteroidia bacterium]|jgi:hypothetical protein